MARLRKGLDEFLERDQARALFDLAPGEQRLSGGVAPPVALPGVPGPSPPQSQRAEAEGMRFHPRELCHKSSQDAPGANGGLPEVTGGDPGRQRRFCAGNRARRCGLPSPARVQAAEDLTDRNQLAASTLHGLFSPVPQNKNFRGTSWPTRELWCMNSQSHLETRPDHACGPLTEKGSADSSFLVSLLLCEI